MRTKGLVRADSATRAAAADDFGHLVHRTPVAVVRPRSADDVAEALRWAGRTGYQVAARGRGHSVWGRSQVDAGVVLDMTGLIRISDVRPDRVTVEAGATWRDVLAATLPLGRTPPVLTDYLDLSVGGTLAVGGVGGTTPTYGLQCDNVLEMDVVTGTGEQLTCSAAENADLFDTVRAGLAQVGVITRATLKLVDAPHTVRRSMLFYPELAPMLRDARELADGSRSAAVQGAALPAPDGGWTYRLEVASYDALLPTGEQDTVTYQEYVDRLVGLEQALRANGQWFDPHPWLMTFVGDAQAVADELERLDPPVDLGSFGQVGLSPIRRDVVGSPMFRLPPDEVCFTFNLVRIPGSAEGLVAANRAVYDRIRDGGGTLYPVSALPMSAEDWRRHFGAAFDRLAEAKRRHDPDNIMTPGYEVFPCS